MSLYLTFSHVFFGYESAAGLLFEDLSLQFPSGWTGIAGANGCGKTTLLRLAAGLLKPEAGTVRSDGLCCFCEQELEVPPPEAAAFFASHDSEAIRLRNALGVNAAMLQRWASLSMGERKKIQVGSALFQAPDILCLDEPTNHLDASTRELLLDVLQGFYGIGLLVSHDRELLDTLCDQCLFIRPWGTQIRSGGISSGMEEEALEQRQSQQEQQLLKNELKRSKKELQRRREKAQKAENSNSKSKVDRYDYDGKGRINAARVTSRSGRAAELAGAQAKTVERNRNALGAHQMLKTAELGLNIPYGSYASRNALLELPPGSLTMGEKSLSFPELTITPRDRIAITGDNGSGKSTLLRHIVRELKIAPEHYLYMPQELDEELRKSIFQTLSELGRNDYSKVMNVVASLGSIPERVLNSDRCSPGEWRKLFFGLGVLREINLIIMDEPTNHLDLPSIQCLEAALKDCECAILLVSHDHTFIERLCLSEWKIENGKLKIIQGV